MSDRRLGRWARRLFAAGSAAFLISPIGWMGCGTGVEKPRVHAGVLDLSRWSFEANGPVQVRGDWQICWGVFADPAGGDCPSGDWEPFPVPRLWTDSGVSSPVGGQGIATYRVRLKLPHDSKQFSLRVGAPMTAYRLWVNRVPLGGAGTVGATPETTVAQLENRNYRLPPGASELELLVHVANFEFRGGGLRRPWVIGPHDQIVAVAGREMLLYAVFASVCLAVGLLFLAQFASRPSERARGWFGLMAAGVAFRIVPGATSDLYQLLMGWTSFGAQIRMEYLDTAILIVAGAGYMSTKHLDVMPPRLTQLLQLAALALIPIHLLAPLPIVLATLPVIMALPPMLVVLTISSYWRATSRGVPGAGSTFVASLIFSAGILHDIVRTQTGLGAPIELFPFFVVVWIANEAFEMLRSFARSLAKVEKLSDDLQESNFELQETEEAVVRFVPFRMLRSLGKRSIEDVRAGDHAEVEMSVMTCHVELPAQSSPADQFAHMNRLVARIGPVVNRHGGFLSHPLPDQITAAFPRSADDAVEAAAALRDASAGTRIGIASGRGVLGTVGGEQSLATVLLGEVVTRSREIAALAARIGAAVIADEATCERLSMESPHELEPVDPARTEGRPVLELRPQTAG